MGNNIETNIEDFIGVEINKNIIGVIEGFPKKLKFKDSHKLYDTGLETAISNSQITEFYTEYKRYFFKKYIKSVPFPFERLSDENIERLNKLNDISKIFENETNVSLSLCKYLCLHLMDIILFDLYFNIKSVQYDVYEKVDGLIVPDKNNDAECKKFAKWFTHKENPINYILFYSNTNNIILKIRNGIR